jgi:quercetin dioxygenase-like cupin family protein
MRLFSFDAETGRLVGRFDSRHTAVTHIVRAGGPFQVVCVHLGTGGVLGGHETVSNQIFCVVQGKGWVRVRDGERVPMEPGRGAFWEAGEWHESGTEFGMTAISIEGEGIEPWADSTPKS